MGDFPAGPAEGDAFNRLRPDDLTIKAVVIASFEDHDVPHRDTHAVTPPAPWWSERISFHTMCSMNTPAGGATLSGVHCDASRADG